MKLSLILSILLMLFATNAWAERLWLNRDDGPMGFVILLVIFGSAALYGLIFDRDFLRDPRKPRKEKESSRKKGNNKIKKLLLYLKWTIYSFIGVMLVGLAFNGIRIFTYRVFGF